MNEGIRPRAYMGIVYFILVMIVMIFTFGPLQLAWGAWGAALCELVLLFLAVVPVLLFRWDVREVFRVRIPPLRQVFGALLLWLGGYIFSFTAAAVLIYFFPESMGDVSEEMVDIFTSVPFAARLLIIAVLPAVCEEALHRGFIFHTFKNAGKWTTVIAMGIIFGLFHLHPLRFVATAILGAVLTYIMLETRNLLLPILVHFVNNALSVILTVDATPGGETMALPLASLGILLLPAVVAPFLLMGGSRLLLAKEERRARPVSKAVWATAIITAVVVAITGFTLIVQGVMDLLDEMELVFETTFAQEINRDTPGQELDFTVEEAGTYVLDLSIQSAQGVLTQVVISSVNGQEVYSTTVREVSGQNNIELAAGTYAVKVSFITESQEPLPVSVEIVIFKSLPIG